MKRMFTIVLFLAILTLPILLSQSGSNSQQQSARFPSARTSKDGDIWLNWDRSRRMGFIHGFREGTDQGHRLGCSAAMDIFVPHEGPIYEPGDSLARCLKAQMLLSRDLEHYEKEITSFYEQFQTDREIPLSVMLWLLSDSMRKSAPEIHECYVAGAIGECKPSADGKATPSIK